MDVSTGLILGGIAAFSFVLSFFGAMVGLVLGHLRLPLLVYCLPSAGVGATTNLAISGMGALTGTVRHLRDGRVSARVLLLMGAPSMLGAVAGAAMLVRFDAVWARLVVGVVLVLTGLSLLSGRAKEGTGTGLPERLRLGFEVLIGFGLGVLASLSGLMLGSLRLPAMIRLCKIDPHVAVGSNMAIGCLTAVVGSLAFWTRGGNFEPLPLLIVGAATVLGGYFGARWTGRFDKQTLSRMIGWTVAATGILMAAEGVWHGAKPSWEGEPVIAIDPQNIEEYEAVFPPEPPGECEEPDPLSEHHPHNGAELYFQWGWR